MLEGLVEPWAQVSALGASHVSHTPAACSFPGENARSWEELGEARPGQSSLSAGAVRYRAWAQSWSSAALAARSVA